MACRELFTIYNEALREQVKADLGISTSNSPTELICGTFAQLKIEQKLALPKFKIMHTVLSLTLLYVPRLYNSNTRSTLRNVVFFFQRIMPNINASLHKYSIVRPTYQVNLALTFQQKVRCTPWPHESIVSYLPLLNQSSKSPAPLQHPPDVCHGTMTSIHLSRFRRWILQSPPAEWVLAIVKNLVIGALRQGPVPRHVAFVCDGNRRYARKHQIETVEGHNRGFESMARVRRTCWLKKLGSDIWYHRF